MRISINGGHFPGEDSGAIGRQLGIQEADITKNISHIVVNILKSDGHNALFIQKNELYQVCDTSNDFGADLFISIHCNSATNTEARGTEVFAYSPNGEGDKLAHCVQSQIVNSLGTIDRGVKYKNFQVLRNTNCPAILVECAFLSNELDECMLADLNTQERFATAIVEGINNYVAG